MTPEEHHKKADAYLEELSEYVRVSPSERWNSWRAEYEYLRFMVTAHAMLAGHPAYLVR